MCTGRVGGSWHASLANIDIAAAAGQWESANKRCGLNYPYPPQTACPFLSSVSGEDAAELDGAQVGKVGSIAVLLAQFSRDGRKYVLNASFARICARTQARRFVRELRDADLLGQLRAMLA